ncbi:hypothetical protein VIBNISOn1_1750025 [Vibrio nigripulchritudo SOn1]|uniref:N-acetyltransferase domain-containing protein n=1 Tax=Vibrio nigripulchritudo SOn1 TaxID=1238450 RepID=A0AAV2VPG1_9VIBR|nr:hypothetical protein [Vibrio nigripulchritudo]CCO46353.1 hypothetical protein VIBNISOn1_1750025 [Vibrio nigripulchritudo SOn1]
MDQDMNTLNCSEVTDHGRKKVVIETLKSWASMAVFDNTEISNEKFLRERAEINKHEYAQCTPSTWGKQEELGCVCLDIVDAWETGGFDEKLYVVTNVNRVCVAVITLSKYNDFAGRVDFEDTEGSIVTITGLVKKPGYKQSIRTGITEFFKILKKNETKMVMVASASGAGKAYANYGFTETRLDAHHNCREGGSKPIACGCMVMYKAL